MNILLAGGTGLVGRAFITLANEHAISLTTVGRRVTGSASNELVVDFAALPALPAAEVAVCTLGTTIADAGSKAAFRAIDFDAVLAFASAAKQAGVGHFLIVTAIGADARASAFYARIKGAVEIELANLGFARLDILQPGLLLGEREVQRPVEHLLQRLAPAIALLTRGPWDRYASISAARLASALLTLCHEKSPGVFYHQSPELQHLGNKDF
jgi:uncharacterized protein YbjT (DUF2867 family)